MYQYPIWKMVKDCAQELTKRGIVPFTRQDIIDCIHQHDPGCKANSINPIIQGLTDNLKGGAPGAVGKKILHSVGRGQFELYSKQDSPISQPPPTPQVNMPKPVTAGNSKATTLETENELRDYILAKLKEKLRLRTNIHLVPEGRLSYQLPNGHTLFHASDILAQTDVKKYVSIELKYKSAVTDQFKCRAFDAIHMKKEYDNNILCIMVFVKTSAGISIHQAQKISYPFDQFFAIPASEIDTTNVWNELSDSISTFL